MLVFSILVLHSVLTVTTCCDWLRHYTYYSNASLTLIRNMGDPMTEQEAPLSFPYRLYRRIRHAEVESQLMFVRESLDQIMNLYRNRDESSAIWDTNMTHHFLQSIERLIDGLDTCVSMKERTNIQLRKYYRKLLRRTLRCTGRSKVSWEILRSETKLHLDQLQLLISSIDRKSC